MLRQRSRSKEAVADLVWQGEQREPAAGEEGVLAVTLAALANFACAGVAVSAGVKVAVAANFTDAAKEIGALFQQKTGHTAVFSFGATGQLFTQISQGAPFEVFLSADKATVTKAGAEGHGVVSTQFTYAVGKLVLYSKSKDAVKGEQTLKDGKFAKLAIANPASAPYGAAAIEAMTRSDSGDIRARRPPGYRPGRHRAPTSIR